MLGLLIIVITIVATISAILFLFYTPYKELFYKEFEVEDSIKNMLTSWLFHILLIWPGLNIKLLLIITSTILIWYISSMIYFSLTNKILKEEIYNFLKKLTNK